MAQGGRTASHRTTQGAGYAGRLLSIIPNPLNAAGVCVCVCVCVCARVHAQSCPTLCNPMNCSPPGSSVLRIFQARILEWACHFLLRGDLPHLGIEPASPAAPALGRQILSHRATCNKSPLGDSRTKKRGKQRFHISGAESHPLNS